MIISLFKDTNTINSKCKLESVSKLEGIAANHPDFLIIEKADALDTELLQNEEKNSKRLLKSANYIESYGIGVVGYSRLGSCVMATANEERELDEILKILFGDKGNKLNYNRTEILDAMHIHTAIKYGATHFITNDKQLLAKSKEIKQRFNSTLITKPEQCLEAIIKKMNILRELGKLK